MTLKIDKDELIQELKAALVRRELRINELELALYYQTNGITAPDGGATDAPCPLDAAASAGVYSDGWIANEATLAFGRGNGVSLTFFLPPLEGAGPKRLTLHSNFGEATTLEVERGVGLPYHLTVPSEIKRPLLNVRCDPEPVNDDRRLGVIIVQ